ncbi:EVE domain-containing protein, partial [Klebsiella pneumoniae]|uniref:EVE domain-containing protein n=1 Tax=Klebsiella pneumoniae TaxID=573 RepID=UPI001A926549
TGVRNATAARNLREMALGDQAFFYHSNIGKEIVGVVEVVRTAYPDPTDATGRWVCVDVKALGPVPRKVTLAGIKADPRLAGLALVRQSRLRSCRWARSTGPSSATWRAGRTKPAALRDAGSMAEGERLLCRLEDIPDGGARGFPASP